MRQECARASRTGTTPAISAPNMKNSYELEIIKRATQEGLNPANLSPSQYRRLAIAVRTPEDLARDAAAAVTSRVLTSMGIRTVSLEQFNHVKSICESNPCQKFKRLSNGEPACLRCQCSGKFLNSKWRDKKGKCPEGLWNNEDLSNGRDVSTDQIPPR